MKVTHGALRTALALGALIRMAWKPVVIVALIDAFILWMAMS